MKIQFNKFLDIFYSIMNNDDIYAIDYVDIMETIKIIYSSDEFKLIASRLNINSCTDKDLENHRFTKEIDTNGIVYFEVDEKEREKILDKNKVDAGFIQSAINKRALAKYFAVKYNGLIEFKYDSPNGLYNMSKVNLPDYVTKSELYTDGKIIQNVLSKNDMNSSINRTVRLDDATFSLFTYFVNEELNKIELRGTFYGDYNILLNESERLISGVDDSFEESTEESPKVYKFKSH